MDGKFKVSHYYAFNKFEKMTHKKKEIERKMDRNKSWKSG